ncbi:MAG: gliding motility lipoprotein GldH [Brumimicrobium sp.]
MIVKSNSHYIKVFLFSTVALLLLSSCGKQPYFDEVHNFEDEVWTEQDTATFNVPVDDTINSYDFIMTLRTSTDYKFSNIWVHVITTAPDNSTSKVAQRIPLARPDGSWLGRVSGTIVESKLRFDSKQFPIKGDYKFEIVKATQNEDIDEVLDISLRVQSSN